MSSPLMDRYVQLRPLSDRLTASGKWDEWRRTDPRLARIGSLADALQNFQDRVGCSRLVVAALVEKASRRGAADDDAALAAILMLEPGIFAMLQTLGPDVDMDDAVDHVWETVVRASPRQGPSCALFILRRAREEIMLSGRRGRHRDADLWPPDSLPEAATDVDVEPLAELLDLISWARARGVVDEADVGLVVELVTRTPGELSANASGAYGTAQLAMAEQRGITVRQLRRRRARVEKKLRDARSDYLADIC